MRSEEGSAPRSLETAPGAEGSRTQDRPFQLSTWVGNFSVGSSIHSTAGFPWSAASRRETSWIFASGMDGGM